MRKLFRNTCHCWKEFTGAESKKYCSRYCAYKNSPRGKLAKLRYWTRVEKVCKQCWKTFLTYSAEFCSETCRDRNKLYWKNWISKQCRICWNSFTTFKKSTLTCSKFCSSVNHDYLVSEMLKKKREQNRLKKESKVL